MRKLAGRCALGLSLIVTPAAAQAQTRENGWAPSSRAADPVSNGIGIGVAIGAATGFGLMHWAYNSCKGNCDKPEPFPMYLGAISMGAAVGGVTGWLIDRARKDSRIRVVPVISRGRKGVFLSIPR
jgi:hypothetical protein